MSQDVETVRARQFENLATLANSVQLATNVVRKVAGNEIADGFDGERLDTTELNETMAAKINGYLMNPAGGKA